MAPSSSASAISQKIKPIRDAIAKFAGSQALSPIKEYLGDGYTYGEIKAVIASM